MDRPIGLGAAERPMSAKVAAASVGLKSESIATWWMVHCKEMRKEGNIYFAISLDVQMMREYNSSSVEGKHYYCSNSSKHHCKHHQSTYSSPHRDPSKSFFPSTVSLNTIINLPSLLSSKPFVYLPLRHPSPNLRKYSRYTYMGTTRTWTGMV